MAGDRQAGAIGRIAAKGRIAYPAAVMVAAGIGNLSLGIVFFARDIHHATPTRIGLLAATWSLAYILSCLFLRPLADRLLPRHSILIAALCMSAAIAAMLGTPKLHLVFVCYALYGGAAAFFWPPLMGWLSTGLEGPPLNRAMGLFNLSWSTGAIIGPAMAGFLARLDARLPIMASALLFLVTALYILAALGVISGLGSEDAQHRAAVAAPDATAPPASEGTFLRFPAWIGIFASYVVLGLVFNVFPLAAQDHFGMSKPVVGILILLRALATTGALVVLGRTTAWHFRGGQLVGGLVLFAVVLAGLPAGSSPMRGAVFMVLIGILSGHSYANSLFHGVTGSRHRSARMALHESLLSAGLVCGGACGGALYQFAGYGPVCWTAAAILLLAAVASLALLGVARRQGLSVHATSPVQAVGRQSATTGRAGGMSERPP